MTYNGKCFTFFRSSGDDDTKMEDSQDEILDPIIKVSTFNLDPIIKVDTVIHDPIIKGGHCDP